MASPLGDLIRERHPLSPEEEQQAQQPPQASGRQPGAERAKCQPLCIPCHRKKTRAGRRRWRRRRPSAPRGRRRRRARRMDGSSDSPRRRRRRTADGAVRAMIHFNFTSTRAPPAAGQSMKPAERAGGAPLQRRPSWSRSWQGAAKRARHQRGGPPPEDDGTSPEGRFSVAHNEYWPACRPSCSTTSPTASSRRSRAAATTWTTAEFGEKDGVQGARTRAAARRRRRRAPPPPRRRRSRSLAHPPLTRARARAAARPQAA